MKKRFVILLILMTLVISACAKKPAEETLPVETVPEITVPAETEPELEYVIAEINGIPAVLKTLSRGDMVDLVEAFDEKHYVVKLDMGYGLVEKNLVRPESQPEYEAWTGYAYHNAELFGNYRLTGEPVKKLASNTKVEVLDDLGWCVLVNHDGTSGYMKPENLSKNPLNSGGSSQKEDASSGGESTGEDGGEIWLRSSGNLTFLSIITPQKGNVSGKAIVLADETDVVLGYFDRGDKIPVMKETAGEDRLTVYLEGLCASVSGTYVRAENEEPHEVWEGCSKYNAALYNDPWMQGSPTDRLNTNTAITVLYELENCYLVEVDGMEGYIPKDFVVPVKTESIPKETVPAQPAQTKPAPTEPEGPTQAKPDEPVSTEPEAPSQSKPTEPEETTPSAESKPSEGNSAGNAGTNSGNPDPEWTPPIL